MSFSDMINSFIGFFDLNRKLLSWRKTKQRKFREKNRRFVDSGIVKTCDELDRKQEPYVESLQKPMVSFRKLVQ